MRLTYSISKLSFIDFLNDDERTLRNAFHEAGHDEIARLRGAKIESVTTDSAGESVIEISGIGNIQNSCSIAVAGFLAEARGIACSPLGKLSRHINIHRVAELAVTIIKALDTPAVVAEGRFALMVPLFPGGRSAEEAVASVADFTDARDREMTQAQLELALVEVSNKLNEDGVWHSVVRTMHHFRKMDRCV